MEEFASVFAAFWHFAWLSVVFHAAMQFPMWLMKGGRWIELWAGPDR